MGGFYYILEVKFSIQEGFMVDKVTLEQVFLRVLQFSPANHLSTIVPHSSITTPRGVR
jgi:branched-subunit amino acid transport protein